MQNVRRATEVPKPLAYMWRQNMNGERQYRTWRQRANEERNYRIVILWNKGYRTSEIARDVGCTNNMVLATIVKHRNLGDITRPMVKSCSDRGRLGIIARYGFRKEKK
jgi:hypothetical protein